MFWVGKHVFLVDILFSPGDKMNAFTYCGILQRYDMMEDPAHNPESAHPMIFTSSKIWRFPYVENDFK